MKKYLIIFLFSPFLLLFSAIYLPKDFTSEKGVIFKIEKGQSSKEIAFNLEKRGLIWWGPLFRGYVLFRGIADQLQAGMYQLSPSLNIPAIVKKFVQGEAIKERITIIEGWNLRDIGFYFENKGMFQAEEFWELVGFPLDPKSKEGYLFPDTYLINYGTSLEEIVQQMEDNFQKKLAPYQEEISAQGKTLLEIIIMASLIEKEVRSKEDKKIVSGIFWKRLKRGKPLESCASIAYLKGVSQWRYSYEDTRIESPYNTYLYPGLPVGPICNPGLESIEAALYPQESDYWYWLSTPEGKTIFSKTLEEHNLAKAKYLKK